MVARLVLGLLPVRVEQDDVVINKRMEIRAAPFPSEIVDLDTVEEVYDWLNTLFGGDHLPDRATEPEIYNAFIKKLEKVRAARSGG